MSRSDEITFFPPIDATTEDGLLMIGGRLNVQWVLDAYRRGIFPWPLVDGETEILAWFCPDPRAVVELDSLYVSRRLARRVNRCSI
jgi:leucyl/phenylalanyl-tRNA--protein transferase